MAIRERLAGSGIVSGARELCTLDTFYRILLGALAGYSITLLAGSSIPALGIGPDLARPLGVVGLGVALVALARLGSCESSDDCGCSASGGCS